MNVRKQNGLPTTPPHVGDDDLLLDEATGRFYGRLADGSIVPLTFAAKDGRLGGGIDPVVNGAESLVFGQYVATGQVIVPAAGEETVAAWTKATKTLTFDQAQDLSGVTAGDDVMLYAWGEGYAGKGVVASVDDGADTLVLTTEVLPDDVAVEVVVLPTLFANQGQGALVTGTWNAAQGAGAMVGGSFNQALGNTSFAMGSENEAEANNSSVFGRRGKAYWRGAMVHGVTLFDVKGDGQIQRLPLTGLTINATPKRLDPGSSGTHLVLEDDRVYLIKALVLGRSTSSNEQAAYELLAIVKRDTGAASVAVVGAVTKTVVHEDDAAWDATIGVNTSAGSVEVQVTGDASLTVRWLARLEVVEVASS